MKRKIYVNNDLDVVTTRMQAREMAKSMGFRTADQARISLAASELARMLSWNTTTPGEILICDTVQNGHQGMEVSCIVQTRYLTLDEKTKDSTLVSMPNRSLTGARQLVDESHVEKQSNQKALVKLIKWLK
jgi:anti-sigma regulatory factor (Ser/Thr protein kinase)